MDEMQALFAALRRTTTATAGSSKELDTMEAMAAAAVDTRVD